MYTEVVMRAVAFHRVSTDKQVDSGLGLEAQERAVVDFARKQGLSIVGTFTEEAVSGKTELHERPQLLNALHVVSQGHADVLVVAKLDRLGRDSLELMTIERILAKSGGRFVSVAGEGTANDDPAQILVRRIMSAVAENEVAMVSLRTKSALKAKAERGEHIGRPPFGFAIEGGELVAGKHFDQVIRVLELRRKQPNQKRMTLQAIADLMNDEQSDVTWSVDKVHRIVSRWKSVAGLKHIQRR
jgi:DNA invertase Pin-like site-specific DNA recombinase